VSETVGKGLHALKFALFVFAALLCLRAAAYATELHACACYGPGKTDA
jgi:hypothetical protein